ncbi:metal ABC transporter permease, partial [Mycobacterium tuberculosis]|nr:metal ABC transporter permease [Mycobacterium tuberculosis]
ACTVAALQTVGAFLVIALVVTPGATAYLLTDRFPRLIAIAAMAAVVVASNILVPYPVAIRLGTLDLADLLTYGAFS